MKRQIAASTAMKTGRGFALVLASGWLGLGLGGPAAAEEANLRWWLSSADLRHQLTELPALPLRRSPEGGTRAGVVRLEVDPAQADQTMLGMGSSLEPATCFNLSRLTAAERSQVIERWVHPIRGIGMNLMRICMGTPDFTGDPWYSYHDLPPGETDPELRRFSIDRDRTYVLPLLQEVRRCNPELKFFASPWSPPGWMKTTGSLIGGSLLPQHYPTYARYFVRFIQAYAAAGIPIHAVTVQNEPGVDRARERDRKWHYPSCRWTGEQERDFIREHLGPALAREGLNTEIWCYDHNYNVRPGPDGGDPGIAYPRTILRDAGAARYVAGVAFHGYEGQPAGMDELRREFPAVPFYFTEGSVFGVKGGVELVEKLRHGVSSYNAWVTLLDERGQPNNGPFEASRTLVTIHPRSLKVTYHFDYFMYGQFMKWVQRGARRIESRPGTGPLAHVAFRNPDGTRVLVLVNPAGKSQPFEIRTSQGQAEGTLPERSVATLVWSAPGDGVR